MNMAFSKQTSWLFLIPWLFIQCHHQVKIELCPVLWFMTQSLQAAKLLTLTPAWTASANRRIKTSVVCLSKRKPLPTALYACKKNYTTEISVSVFQLPVFFPLSCLHLVFLSIMCWWTPARHTSDAGSLRHFLCWSIFSEHRSLKSPIPSWVPTCCLFFFFFSEDRNPRQTLTKGQHPSSHLEDEGRRPKQYKQHKHISLLRETVSSLKPTSCVLPWAFSISCLMKKYVFWLSGQGKTQSWCTQGQRRDDTGTVLTDGKKMRFLSSWPGDLTLSAWCGTGRESKKKAFFSISI